MMWAIDRERAENAEANRRALEMARHMTPAEVFALSVRAGIHRPDGRLTQEYGAEEDQ